MVESERRRLISSTPATDTRTGRAADRSATGSGVTPRRDVAALPEAGVRRAGRRRSIANRSSSTPSTRSRSSCVARAARRVAAPRRARTPRRAGCCGRPATPPTRSARRPRSRPPDADAAAAEVERPARRGRRVFQARAPAKRRSARAAIVGRGRANAAEIRTAVDYSNRHALAPTARPRSSIEAARQQGRDCSTKPSANARPRARRLVPSPRVAPSPGRRSCAAGVITCSTRTAS